MKKIMKIVLALLTFVIIIDPSNTIFHIKWLLGLFIAVVTLFGVVTKGKTHMTIPQIIWLFIAGIVALIPVCVTYNTSIAYDPEKLVGFTFSIFSFAFLLWIIIENEINLFFFLSVAGLGIAGITIVLFVSYWVAPDIYFGISEYLIDKEALMAGERESSLTAIQVYYKTSATLIIPLAYHINSLLVKNNSYKRRVLFFTTSTIFFWGMVFSGTRANVLLAVIVLCAIIFMKLCKSRIMQISVVLIILSSTLISMGWIFSNQDEYSNKIKLGHLVSYLELFEKSPEILLTGQGAGSQFYSQSKGIVSLTELTYFELIRVMGIPLFLIFLIFLLLPYYLTAVGNKTTINEKSILVGYTGYLFIAATNPLILGSTGIYAIVCTISQVLANTKNWR